MKSDVLSNLTLTARTAYAVMCFERYVSAKYPGKNYKPAAEMMWHIVDGSEDSVQAAYKFAEIIPESLFEARTFAESGFRYMTQKHFAFYRRVINDEDANLNTLMNAVFNISMAYAYAWVKPGAPETLPHLQQVMDILEAAGIPLPEPELLAQYSVANLNPRAFQMLDWNGGNIDPTGLSVFGIMTGSSTIEEASEITAEANGCTWVIDWAEDGLVIKKCRNNAHLSTLNIPAVLNGRPVVAIADNAFLYTPESACQYVENLIIPDSVVRIGNNFFKDCRRLRTVKMSAGIVTIGNHAFADTTMLASLTIGNSCKTIGSNFCAGASGLQTVQLGTGIQTIGDYAFYNCRHMTSFRCDAEIMKLGYGSFWCNNWADTIIFNPANDALFFARNNCLLYRYVKQYPPAVVCMDASVKYVFDHAFGGDAWNCGGGITDIYLPGAERIGIQAFKKVPNATVHLSISRMQAAYGENWQNSVNAICRPAKVVCDLP